MAEKKRFVDIHTHILPGLDDGPKDLPEALAMVQRAWHQGTGAIVLTPHYRGKFQGNLRPKLESAFLELKREAQKLCPGIQLYLGCEVGYEMDVTEKIVGGSVLSINDTRYVLLEFRDTVYRSRLLTGTLEALNLGYTPIIAHVERYDALRRNPEIAKELNDLGALLQINADSVLGLRGLRLRFRCHRLLKQRLVHFVASDAHDVDQRTPDLKECYEYIARKYSRRQAHILFHENARKVLCGREDIEC